MVKKSSNTIKPTKSKPFRTDYFQNFGKDTDFLIRIQKQDGNEKQQIAMIEKVKLITIEF